MLAGNTGLSKYEWSLTVDNNNVNTNYSSDSLRFKLFCPLAVASVLRGVSGAGLVTCDCKVFMLEERSSDQEGPGHCRA